MKHKEEKTESEDREANWQVDVGEDEEVLAPQKDSSSEIE